MKQRILSVMLLASMAASASYSDSLTWIQEGEPVREFIVYFDSEDPYTYEIYVVDFNGELQGLEGGVGEAQYDFSVDVATSGTAIVALPRKNPSSSERASITVSRVR